MKRIVLALATAGLACATGLTGPAAAQSGAATAPNLSSAQSAEVTRQLDLYRSEVNGRVARGEITGDEGSRLLQWREWQLTQQAAGLAPPPAIQAPPVREQYAVPYYQAAPYYQPAPYYAPYYGPYYAPRYYWGPSICAGGWGHHGGGRICI